MSFISRFQKSLTPSFLLLFVSFAAFQPAIADDALLDRVRAGEDVKIVLLGTSLTENGSWPASLQTWLAGESPGPGTVTIVNRAASGQASDHGLNVQTPAALLDSPDAVFIEFSMNDAATVKNISQQQSEDNLNAIIDQFEVQNPDIIIVMQTMNSLPADTSPFSPRADLNGYYQVYRDVAAERGATLVDHYPNWLDLFTNNFATWDSYMRDAVHPNALGEINILVPELQSVLEAEAGPPLPRTFLAAWDDWENFSGSETTPDDIGVTGFSGTLTSSRIVDGNFGTNDGTYGTAISGANPSNIRGLLPNQSNPGTSFSITNDTGQPYTIDSLHFDLVQRAASARTLTVTYVSGGLGPVSTVVHQESFATITPSPPTTPTVLHEYDFILANFLNDRTLGDGETATFEITLADFAGDNSTFIDNLAFRGTAAGNPANSAPTWLSIPITEVQADENMAYSSSLADDAEDADDDLLIFAKVSGPAWLGVAGDGALSGTPGPGDLDENTFVVSVSDGIAAPVQTTLNINVASFLNRPPTFNSDPFSTADGTVGRAYGGTIGQSASDPDNDPLTYTKETGPSWLVIAPDGTLSGIPTLADEGLNQFKVSASDGEADSVEATLGIFMLPNPGLPNGVILAQWDVWTDVSTPYQPDAFITGFTGSVSTNLDRINTDFGSTDGSFGLLEGASTNLTGLLVRESGSNLEVTVSIANNTGQSYAVNSLHFDFGARILSPNSFTLTYIGGGLGDAGTQIDSQSGLARFVGASQAENEGDYYDFDYNLASLLSDVILDDGESAEFLFVFTGQTSAGASSIVDNIAFQGSPVSLSAPRLSNFTYDAVTGNCSVDLNGRPNTAYKLVEADTLDFSNPSQDPIPLTNVSAGTLSDTSVITSGAGNATVEFNLGTTRNATFFRAEETP